MVFMCVNLFIVVFTQLENDKESQLNSKEVDPPLFYGWLRNDK